jgi:predicted PurR-regulated permease PerM
MAFYGFAVIASLILATALLINLASFADLFGAVLSFLSPILYGLVLAYFCNALMKKFETYIFKRISSRKIRRILSISATYVTILLFIALLLLMVIPQIAFNIDRLAESLIELFNQISTLFNEKFAALQKRFDFTSDFQLNFKTLTDFLSSLGGKGNMLATLPMLVLESLVTIFLTVFFATCVLYHKEAIFLGTKKCIALILPRKGYRAVIKATHLTDRTFGRFFIGQIFDAMIVGAVMFLILGAIHLFTGEMRYYAVISVICAVTNVIPYFGPFIGGIPSAIIVLTDSLPMTIAFVIVVLVVQQIDGNIICPAIIGQAVGMSSLWVIISITVTSAILGPIGMFVGVPLFSLFYAAIKFLVERRLKKKGLPIETAVYESTAQLLAELHHIHNKSPNESPADSEQQERKE